MGRPEKSLETFAACPAPDNPLVAFLGNEGCVPLVSLRSRQCVGDLKMSGTVRTATFSSDGQELLTSGRGSLKHASHHSIPILPSLLFTSTSSPTVTPSTWDKPVVACPGNEGCVLLVSLRSRQCVRDL